MKTNINLAINPAPSTARKMFALTLRFAVLVCVLLFGQAARAQTLGKYFPLYISSTYDNTIYKLDINGNLTVFTSGGYIFEAHGIAFDAHGNLYVSSISTSAIVKVDSTGHQTIFTSGGFISGPRGLAFDKAGNLYIASYDNNLIVKADSTGKQTLFASGTNFMNPRGLVFDAAGNLYVGNSWNGAPVVKIDPAGNQSIYSSTQAADGLAFDTNGLLWVGSIDLDIIGAIRGDGSYAASYFTLFQNFNPWSPPTMAFDYQGNLWSSDYYGFGVGTVSIWNDQNEDPPFAALNVVTTTPSNPVSLAFSPGYTTTGFAAPIANPPGINTGKAGRTYPVKWQLANPDGSLVTSLSAVASITYNSVACASFGNGTSTQVTTTASGNSSLRYDSTANQFVYNWATPSTPGCYDLTVTFDNQQTLMAYFNLQ